MTVYSIVQLSVAALCALMAAFHLGLWLTVRADRVQLWVALSFFGYALVAFGIAGSSSAARAAMGNPLVWIAFFAAGAIPLFLAPLRAAELMIGRDLGPSRIPYHRALLVV